MLEDKRSFSMSYPSDILKKVLFQEIVQEATV